MYGCSFASAISALPAIITQYVVSMTAISVQQHAGSVPAGSVPAGSVPAGSVAAGSVPAEAQADSQEVPKAQLANQTTDQQVCSAERLPPGDKFDVIIGTDILYEVHALVFPLMPLPVL